MYGRAPTWDSSSTITDSLMLMFLHLKENNLCIILPRNQHEREREEIKMGYDWNHIYFNLYKESNAETTNQRLFCFCFVQPFPVYKYWNICFLLVHFLGSQIKCKKDLPIEWAITVSLDNWLSCCNPLFKKNYLLLQNALMVSLVCFQKFSFLIQYISTKYEEFIHLGRRRKEF